MKAENFLFSLGLTLLIELPMALFFGLKKRELPAAVLINTLTNPLVVFFALLLGLRYQTWNPFLYQLPLEAAVIGVEGLCYKHCTEVRTPWLLSLAANCASYGLGLVLQLIF